MTLHFHVSLVLFYQLFKALFTLVWTNFCSNKNLHLHRTGGTGVFEQLQPVHVSVQVWCLKKEGPKLAHLAVQKFIQVCRYGPM